jgi:hypothetical protein
MNADVNPSFPDIERYLGKKEKRGEVLSGGGLMASKPSRPQAIPRRTYQNQ